MSEHTINAIAPYFGGKRTLAPEIVRQLGPHTQYFEPCCGSLAVLFAKQPSQKETVNDLHGDLINLARCIQVEDAAERLYHRLAVTPFCEDLLFEARDRLAEPAEWLGVSRAVTAAAVERAYWYFLASWMGRNGTAGTAREDYQIAVRWTKGGGSPTVRWSNAVESIPWWHRRLLNVVILCRDMFRILDCFEDVAETAIYVDPPYHASTRGKVKDGKGGRYLHEFNHGAGLLEEDGLDDHGRLAEILRGYRRARVVVSYYDCDVVRRLYEGWTFVEFTRVKHLHSVGGRDGHAIGKEAPEVLIMNGRPMVGGLGRSWRSSADGKN